MILRTRLSPIFHAIFMSQRSNDRARGEPGDEAMQHANQACVCVCAHMNDMHACYTNHEATTMSYRKAMNQIKFGPGAIRRDTISNDWMVFRAIFYATVIDVHAYNPCIAVVEFHTLEMTNA